jgi:hypothetical protein
VTAVKHAGEVGGVRAEPGDSLQRSLKSDEGVADRLDSDDSRVSVSDL